MSSSEPEAVAPKTATQSAKTRVTATDSLPFVAFSGYKGDMDEISARRLPPHQQLIRTERWPVVGESRPRQNDATPWTVTVAGCITQEITYSLESLRKLGFEARKLDVHCVTRWSKFDMEFLGVPLNRLLTSERLESSAKYVSFVARSDRNHSTSLPLEVVRNLDCLIAFEAEGHALTNEHGGPVRMVVPGRYFYKSVKWLERIELLSEDHLGYWEADAGYHNEADPWLEQRYLASALTKQEAERLIALRDFSNQSLMGLAATKRELPGLVARSALLRNADFQQANLPKADFTGSNLSNARFARANLRQADFRNADLDGADFAGADLRGADLRAGSMFGTSFAVFASPNKITVPAIFDKSTRFDASLLDALTVDQRRFIQSHL